MKSNRTVYLLFLLFFFFAGAFSLSAGGRKERYSLERAESLIQEKRYNEAVAMLSEILKGDPDDFDEATRLLREVKRFQDAYNKKYDELLNAYGVDLELSYLIIKELEEMNPYADERTKQNLIRARETAGFVYNRNRWIALMDEALALINQGQYRDAVERYRSGFNLSRDIFDDADYGETYVNRTNELHVLIEDALGRFSLLWEDLNRQKAQEQTALAAEDYRSYAAAFEPLYASYRELAEILSLTRQAARSFGSLAVEIEQVRGDNKEVHHLVYMDLLLAGRPDAAAREGVTGVLEKIWSDGVAELTEHTGTLAEKTYQAGVSLFSAGELGGAEESFVLSGDFSRIDIRAVDLWGLRIPEDLNPADRNEEQQAIFGLWQFRLANSSMRLRGAEEFINRTTAQERINTIAEEIQGLSNLAAGPGIRGEIQSERSLTADTQEQWRGIQREFVSGPGGAAPETEGSRVITGLLSVLDGQVASLLGLATDLVEGLAQIEHAAYAGRLAELQERHQRGVGYLNGIPFMVSGGRNSQEIIAPFPDRAIADFEYVGPLLTELAVEIRDTGSRLREEETGIRNAPSVQASIGRMDTLLSEIQQIQGTLPNYIQRANQSLFEAERFRQEGDRRIVEARQFFAQSQFPAAKERLSQASIRFDESLSFREDAELRRQRDEDIPRLYAQIQDAENNLVVEQVRQYLSQGQRLYLQTEYASANALFLQAQNRWADTNVVANAEVEYWLELTRNALSVTLGQDLVATDPLYPEMTQYLNQAAEDYNIGLSHRRAGRMGEAEEAFSRAEKNINYVQQFFPYNKEARVLGLRVTQQRDPDAFREVFARDFQAARAKIGTNSQEAYLELMALRELEPNFSGLSSAIIEAEYDLGLRQRPVDNTRIAAARTNFQNAQRIYNTGNVANFSVGIAYLEEAIELNPNYDEAKVLVDQMRIAMGGTSSAIISNADRRLYEEALAELTAGNYLRAQIIVETLLNNPVNRSNAEILALQRRIETSR